MNIKPDQLAAHLEQGLQPMYIVQGDEPLQHKESCDLIRACASKAGYESREVFFLDKNFDWSELFASTQSMSLFSHLRLLEMRLGNAKLGDSGSKALLRLVEDPPPDTVLLFISDKLERATTNSKWYKKLQSAAVIIQVWPINVAQMPDWIAKRASRLGFQLDHDAAFVLSQRCEGNLLAASQELEKLALLEIASPGSSRTRMDASTVLQYVTDSSRYDVFTLTDAALDGQLLRTRRILNGLRGEAVEPVLILWAVTREIRSLIPLAEKLRDGMALTQILNQRGIWAQRKAMIGNCLKRLSVNDLEMLLVDAAELDRAIKGIANYGQVWDGLLKLVLNLAGKKLSLRAG